MSAPLKVFKVNSLPQTLETNSIYCIPFSNDFAEIYITSNNTPVTVRRIITYNDVDQMINDAIANFTNIIVVNDIAARNALNPTRNLIVLVLDATGDPSVNSGAATYVYNVNTSTWTKISEWESLDLIIKWSDIQGRPTSSVDDIDDAVAKKHAHNNFSLLEKITELNGEFQYNNDYPLSRWSSTNW